jgi:phosphorylcholine metabolism protein LicD
MKKKYFTILTDDMKYHLFILLNKLDSILRENNIRYFIIGGTLLGSVRNSKFIPWDDDADIGILKEDLERFNKINFEKYGLKNKSVCSDGIGKIMFKDKYDNINKMEGVFVDVFTFEKIENKYMFTFDKAREWWPNEYFYEDELFPLKVYHFEDIKLYGPKESYKFCDRAWGKNWRDIKYRNMLYYYKYNFYKIMISIYIVFIFIFIFIWKRNN